MIHFLPSIPNLAAHSNGSFGAKIPAPLILASASPRRKELLSTFGIPFTIVPSGVDESTLTAPSPFEFAVTAARAKCLDVAGRQKPGAVILGADTIVCFLEKPGTDEIILGKPSGPEEARSMLGWLRGREHRVITGVAVRTAQGHVRVGSAVTRVRFRLYSENEIAQYVESGEPLDKAGAYGAQGLGRRLIESVKGDFTNVIGLPMPLTVELLGEDYAFLSIPAGLPVF